MIDQTLCLHESSENEHHAFLKKLAILPCPFFAPAFPLAAAAGLGAGFGFFGSGSSSENDSQTASSFVTSRASECCRG